MLLVAVPVGLEGALLIAPTVESWLFADDLNRWLDGQIGTGQGAWMFLLAPAYAFAAFYFSRDVNNYLRMRTADWRHERLAVLDLGKFIAGAALVMAAAWTTSLMLTEMGFDPRGTFVGTYDQRNSLVVGFVMGFAIIPIIFTIADDALTAVPESLRSASLGAGATQWQTVVHVVVPTAMSGLFSAVMIGLGRAVGETMIVLMGSGNTPTLSWNVFQGFRTLSANIAVELPEAVPGSTHFRLLYLQALILFAITFLLNSVAETIRQRFRKRAYEL
ncbi:MAG: ABC transporter permease subunit [Planctomycetes bacterium]|nr:ABC transporter permease subunit [Planctomycetota bacterium]